jgi:hypothetical protein
MPLSSNRYEFAEERASVFLRELVGSFELILVFNGIVNPIDQVAHWIIVHSGRVRAQTKFGAKELGTAFPILPVEIRQQNYPSRFNIELMVTLLPSQLAALEALRDGGDLNMQVTVSGISGQGDEQNQAPERQELQVQIAKSTWVAALRGANAVDILLLEIPMPVLGATKQQRAIAEHIRRAQSHFVGGHYTECVAECRKVVEQLEHHGAPSVWPLLHNKDSREAMSKDDRERAILATAKHYAHLSAHSEAMGGTLDYSRSDAKFLLAILAVIAAH